MADFLLAHEPATRLAIFAGTFALMIVWEMALPRKVRSLSRWARWPSNIGIVVLNTVVLRVIMPTTAVGFALIAEANGWGLFNLVAVPQIVAILVSILLLDLAIYTQHVVFHAVPFLWRLHRMHHADQDIDVTTGSRFHPIEILISMGIKLAVISILGAPAVAVLIFETVLNAAAIFNHANVRLSPKLDSVLRLLIVTPDMHRVHHSIHRQETNSNFGFNLPWWDRIFATYTAQPMDGHDDMVIGIEHFRTVRDQRLDRMIVQPLRNV
ncbi:MAG: sterol desaturase family protein [Alphaproteobacteria bacterium]